MRKIATSAAQSVHEEKKVAHCKICKAIVFKGQKFCYNHRNGINNSTVKGE